MSFLEEFEEKEEKVEMSLEEYVKTLIEESFSNYSQEVNSLHEIAKTKTAEMILEFTKIQELKKKTEEYQQQSEDISKKMVENSEKFTKVFEEKLEEIKNTNEIFETSLRESRFFEKLEEIFYNAHQNYLQSSKEALQEIEIKANRSMFEMEKRLKLKDRIMISSWIIFLAAILFLIFSYYNVREEVSTYQKEISLVKQIMREEKKYWYDEKSRIIYTRDKKEYEEKNKKK